MQARGIPIAQPAWAHRRRERAIISHISLSNPRAQKLEIIVATAFGHLDKAETKAFELANLEVLINAVLYNPGAALALIAAHRPGGARIFFDRWFVAVNAERGLPRVHDKTLSIVALSALLEMEPAAVPAELRDGWLGIVAGAIQVFKGLPKAVAGTWQSEFSSPPPGVVGTVLTALAARKALQDSLHDDDEGEDDDEEHLLNMNDEEGDVWDEDSAYIEMLAKEVRPCALPHIHTHTQSIDTAQGKRLREAAERKEHDADGGASDVSDEEEIEEELGFISPLDTVNPYVRFKQALASTCALYSCVRCEFY